MAGVPPNPGLNFSNSSMVRERWTSARRKDALWHPRYGRLLPNVQCISLPAILLSSHRRLSLESSQRGFGPREDNRFVAGVTAIAHLKNIFRLKKYFWTPQNLKIPLFLPVHAFFTPRTPRLMPTAGNTRYPQKKKPGDRRFRHVTREQSRISQIAAILLFLGM